MTKTRRNTTPMLPIAKVRTTLARMQTRGERVVTRLRHDAERFMARSRTEVLKEVRDVERRILKAMHAATPGLWHAPHTSLVDCAALGYNDRRIPICTAYPEQEKEA